MNFDREVGEAVAVDVGRDHGDALAIDHDVCDTKLADAARKIIRSDKGERLVSGRRGHAIDDDVGAGVDRRQIDAVDINLEIHDVVGRCRAAFGDAVVVEHVATEAAGENVAATAADDIVVAVTASDDVRLGIAG